MDLGTVIVIIVLNLLFFGFVVWMAIYSRQPETQDTNSVDSETGVTGK